MKSPALKNKIAKSGPAVAKAPCGVGDRRLRFEKALEALQAQSACATAMLTKKPTSKDKPADRERLKSAQKLMAECEPETGLIWRFVMSGQAGKTIPDLTMADLEPLISELGGK